MYYDTLNNSYLTQEEFDELNIDADAEHSGFCVFPKPYPNPKFKAKYYHLGDIGDRGPENVMSFAFLYNLLERYEKERGVGKFPVYLTLGNHESKDCGFGAGANGAKSHPLYLPILTKMIFKNYIKTGYVLGRLTVQLHYGMRVI